jgi:hypothetical protein
LAAKNLLSRYNDIELASCEGIEKVKAILHERHERWRNNNAYP